MTAENHLKSIDLAAVANFALGALSVRPSLREIANGAGAVTLEPRVMQVLVALAQSGGQVVSRDQLVRLCWNGRAVGEDAIQRAIAKVRRLGEATNAFTIDTVARVGYRLRVDALAQAILSNAATKERTLAVLPFENLSDDREMQFFSDGISEEILNTIARAKDVRVIGRGSAFQFRGDDKNVTNVASKLNVTHVLDGSVRRVMGRIRINAHLVETREQTTIWADQFDRNANDTLGLQQDIARLIATALHTSLAPIAGRQLLDPEAYEQFLRARQVRLDGLSDDQICQAIPLLEQSVANAPGFSRAWGALAQARAHLLPRDCDCNGTSAHDAALAAANRALQLDANCSEALTAQVC